MTPTADTPALADLDATTLESFYHIARRYVEYRAAVPFDANAFVTAKRAYIATFGAESGGPERVAQLVVAARALDWLLGSLLTHEAEDRLALVIRAWNSAHPTGGYLTLESKLAAIDAARAGRPTEGTDAEA